MKSFEICAPDTGLMIPRYQRPVNGGLQSGYTRIRRTGWKKMATGFVQTRYPPRTNDDVLAVVNLTRRSLPVEGNNGLVSTPRRLSIRV